MNILSNALFSNNQVVDQVNYKILLDLAYIQSVFMQVYPMVRDKLTKTQKDKYSKIFLEYVANNTQIEEEHISLNNKLSENGISFVLFKGCVSASYYKNPELRILGDVDFWAKASDVNKVKSLFRKDFICKDEKSNHISFIKETKDIKEVYELHTLVNGIPDNSIGDTLKSYFDNILDEKVVLKLSDGDIYVPSDFHHGLILIIHMLHHMTNEGIGLRHLCDFAVFVNSFCGDDFPILFKEKLEKVGLWKFTQIMTLVCSEYLGMPDKEWANIKEENIKELLNEIIVDIFESGNFGHNDHDRYRQIKYMNTDETDSTAKKMSKSLFQKVERQYPVVKIKKVLYIKYTAKVAFDFLSKVIKKERKIDNVSKVIDGATKRKEIYNKLELFEINE